MKAPAEADLIGCDSRRVPGFTAHRLEFQCHAATPMVLPPYKGSTFRGAFFSAALQQFCLNRMAPSCHTCPASAVCPIARLAATVDPQSDHGQEVPRPFALEPPLDGERWYAAGAQFRFALMLLGDSLPLYPYVVLAVRQMGEAGMGNRGLAPGRFTIEAAHVTNPLTGASQPLWSQADGVVRAPQVAITTQDVEAAASRLPHDRLRLRLLTPMRLVADGALVHSLTFELLMRALFRRLTFLAQHFGGTLDVRFDPLLEAARRIRVAADRTRWLDLGSFSRRQMRSTPIGGIVGDVTFEGDLSPFLTYLVWGQIVHVGKDVTKGNGYFLIEGGNPS